MANSYATSLDIVNLGECWIRLTVKSETETLVSGSMIKPSGGKYPLYIKNTTQYPVTVTFELYENAGTKIGN